VLAVTLKYAAATPTTSREKVRDEPVAAPVAVVVQPAALAMDAGVPTFVRVTISGGVPPFNVTCSSSDGSFAPLPQVATDGSFLVPWTPSGAGPSALTGSVRDSLGAFADGPWTQVTVHAPLELTLLANATVNSTNTTLVVHGIVAGGSNASLWAVSSDPLPSHESVPFGNATGHGFGWTAAFVQEGVATVDVEILDPAGDLLRENVTTPLPLALTGNATTLLASGSPRPSVRLLLTTSGGVAPYSVWVNSSWGDRWNGSDPTGGSYVIEVPLREPGEVNLSVTCSDSRGSRFTAGLTELVPGSARGPTPPAPPSWVSAAAVGLFGVFGGALVAVRWRRRRPEADLPPLDPAAVLERLIAPADGADRLTIELMAEEAGVPLSSVRATIDRLVSEGRIRSESDPDGGEVLAWSTDPVE
jgi:hypothetical protein